MTAAADAATELTNADRADGLVRERSTSGRRRYDEAAYTAAIRQHGERLLGVARRLLRSEEDARDTVQDALLSAYQSLEQFEERAQLSTWLHRIVVNSALMRLRSRRRRPEELTDDPWATLAGADRQAPCSNPAEPPDFAVERAEIRSLLSRCIDDLPESYRAVLLLRSVGELDTTETARVLGVTSSVVRCRLHRAHRAMRALLERQAPALLPAGVRAAACQRAAISPVPRLSRPAAQHRAA